MGCSTSLPAEFSAFVLLAAARAPTTYVGRSRSTSPSEEMFPLIVVVVLRSRRRCRVCVWGANRRVDPLLLVELAHFAPLRSLVHYLCWPPSALLHSAVRSGYAALRLACPYGFAPTVRSRVAVVLTSPSGSVFPPSHWSGRALPLRSRAHPRRLVWAVGGLTPRSPSPVFGHSPLSSASAPRQPRSHGWGPHLRFRSV